jgi:hypothetical protein
MKSMPWTRPLGLALFLLTAPSAHAVFWGVFSDHNITGRQGSWDFRLANGRQNYTYYVDIGPNCNSLVIETGIDSHGGYGNGDLYVRKGSLPTRTSYLRRSVRANHQERIFLRKPSPGRYYIRLWARTNYRTCIRFTARRLGAPADPFKLDRCNWERIIRGRPKLALNSRLNTAARLHAQSLYTYNYYSHTGRTEATRTVTRRVANTGYAARAARENIGRINLSEDQINAWMRNTTDRANILNSAMRHVGFYSSLSNGRGASVAVFAQPR